MLSQLTVDVAVLSASDIALTSGLSTADPETAELKKVAIRASRQRVLVGDDTKFGVTTFCRYARVEDCMAVVTDRGLSSALAARSKPAGTRLIRA